MPSEPFEHSQISGPTMTSGGMSCERSGTIARGTNRVSADRPGTNTLAVTPPPSSSCASGYGSPHRSRACKGMMMYYDV
jgi:hypothetical protein